MGVEKVTSAGTRLLRTTSTMTFTTMYSAIGDNSNCQLQGVPQLSSHFDSVIFVRLLLLKQSWGSLEKIQNICYMIGTRIFNIDSEIAENYRTTPTFAISMSR